MALRVALIGSFRQHYDEIQQVWSLMTSAGLEVTSPKGSAIIQHGIPFVRFTSDPPTWDDPTVQTAALHRILRADLTFVVAPAGYVGRTTCYEVGRIIQAGRPLYFSNKPADLPVSIPEANVIPAIDLVAQIGAGGFVPLPLTRESATPQLRLEADLVVGNFRGDVDLARVLDG